MFLTMSSRLFAPMTLVPEVKREGDDSSGIIMVLMLSIVGKRILTWNSPLCLVCKKVINLLNSDLCYCHSLHTPQSMIIHRVRIRFWP